MINRTSRYYDGVLAQTPNKYTGVYEISVFRNFAASKPVKYITYVWKESDTLSAVANAFGEGSTFPQVVFESKHLGGCVDTIKYLQENSLL